MNALCPEPGCTELSDLSEPSYLASTDGPVLHVRSTCHSGTHDYYLPYERLNLVTH